MIQSFRHRGLERFFLRGIRSGIQAQHENKLILASSPLDMNLPGLHMHELKGQRNLVSSSLRQLANDIQIRWAGRVRRQLRGLSLVKMHNPPHPGEVIRELYLEPLGITITDAAKGLGVTRKTLSAILNRRAGISPEMAIRLSKAFGTSPESWLNQQTQYDLWVAEQTLGDVKVKRLVAA